MVCNICVTGKEGNSGCVLLSNTFYETSRDGKTRIQKVILVLSRSSLIITEIKTSKRNITTFENRYIFPLSSVEIFVFKKSKRKTLKVQFSDKTSRYFEIENRGTNVAYWSLWCRQTVMLRRNKSRIKTVVPMNLDWHIVLQKWEPQKLFWNDKYLYMGPKREIEDMSRPTPVPGLGLNEDIKLFYLKPQYFGCWDQSEHWVQCESSKQICYQ